MTRPKQYPGMLISFEGTEGSGKSTLIQHLSTLLQSKGYSVLITREPGGEPLAEKIRHLLLHTRMNPWTELLLYEAARVEHTTQVLIPALQKGSLVLCDRFTDSTLAYQSFARGLPWDQVKTLNKIATLGISPQITLLLDIPPQQGLARVQDPNRFEAEGLDFQKKVRRGYLKACAENPKRWLIIPIRKQSPDALAAHVLQALLCRRDFTAFTRAFTSRIPIAQKLFKAKTSRS